MDRRSTPRLAPAFGEANAAVTLVALGADADSDVRLSARIRDWSSAGMRLDVGQPVPLGTPVRVSWANQLALGEVCHCSELQPGEYSVGLRLREILTGLDQLRRLSARLMGQARETADSRP